MVSGAGIVGRTGSGKSTLLLAILRSMELYAGAIRLGGVDLRTLGVTSRRALAFADTIRQNLRYRLIRVRKG